MDANSHRPAMTSPLRARPVAHTAGRYVPAHVWAFSGFSEGSGACGGRLRLRADAAQGRSRRIDFGFHSAVRTVIFLLPPHMFRQCPAATGTPNQEAFPSRRPDATTLDPSCRYSQTPYRG